MAHEWTEREAQQSHDGTRLEKPDPDSRMWVPGERPKKRLGENSQRRRMNEARKPAETEHRSDEKQRSEQVVPVKDSSPERRSRCGPRLRCFPLAISTLASREGAFVPMVPRFLVPVRNRCERQRGPARPCGERRRRTGDVRDRRQRQSRTRHTPDWVSAGLGIQ
jgi:hypothetical protein